MDEYTFALDKPRLLRELNTVVTVAAREITVFLKSPGTAIMSLALPLVMMGMIGGNLRQNMANGLSFDFGRFMLVGMLVNMLFMTTTMSMTSLIDDHDIDFNQEMLVSPVSRHSLVIGKILGGSFGAIVSMLGTLIVGIVMGITLPFGKLLLILVLSPLMCLSDEKQQGRKYGRNAHHHAADVFVGGHHPHQQLERRASRPQQADAHDLLPRPHAGRGLGRVGRIQPRGDVQPRH